jgi:ribosomal-protein-alanine N-acetyltransferase
MPFLTVRELHTNDIPALVNYWMRASPDFLTGMGVDLAKLPSAKDFSERLNSQLLLPVDKRVSYCLIWELDGERVGHCNTNPTFFGNEAMMHLHMWNSENRGAGYGLEFVNLSLPHFFKTLQLKKLISEPYALNPSPNKTLNKAGFELVKEYTTVPGSLNFEQPVKRWELTVERYRSLRN